MKNEMIKFVSENFEVIKLKAKLKRKINGKKQNK